jgi:hypothetical protein
MKEIRKLIFGYDGSPAGDAAINNLKQAGLPPRLDVLVVSAVDVFLPKGRLVKMPMSIRKTVIKAHADARKQFKEAKSIAKMAGGKIKFLFPGGAT